MGKWKKNKGKSPHRKGNDQDGKNYVATIVDQGNFKFEAYYAAQGIHNVRYNEQDELVPCETHEERNAERILWRKTIGSTLPSSFRIAKDVPENIQQHVQAEIEELAKELRLEVVDGDKDGPSSKPVIQSIGFLPGAYQFTHDRTTIRKHPALQKLHAWLMEKTNAGFISRQETVSMIPPVVLNVQPTDRIADLCAAPGSKASQLLEALGPDGCMIANDANWQRAHMLVTQLRRIMHNNPVVMITNCNAQFFPAVTQFDRILCDVPCSGDATTRKNIGIWKRWSQMAAFGLNTLQVDIAWKGCAQLLKNGGELCYSTCSFNPIENEAVVAELLRRSEGKLELVDIKLEGFKTRPGMSKWKVFCEQKSRREIMNEYKKSNPKMQQRRKEFEDKQQQGEATSATGGDADLKKTEESTGSDAQAATNKKPVALPTPLNKKYEPSSMLDEADLIELAKSAGMEYFASHGDVPSEFRKRLRASVFPPTEDEAKAFHLERCIRAMPQDNDTGGFFVALLRKKGIMSVKDRRAAEAAVELEKEPDVKRAKVDDVTVDVDEEEEDEAKAASDVDEEDIDLDFLDAENKPIRGRNKANFVRDEDGKLNPELGRDDFLPVADEVLDPIVDFYGLTLPGFRRDLYMTRAVGEAKVIYYIAKTVKDVIDQGIQKRVTMINSGLKGFTRNSKACEVPYRLCQEGAHFLAPYMSKRKYVVGRSDFDICLNESGSSHLSVFSTKFQEEMQVLSTGSFIILLEGFAERHGEKMLLAMWKGRGYSVDGMVSKVERDIMRTKLAALDAINSS